MTTFEIDKTVKIKTPRTPNFIDVDGQYISITELSDVQLKAVGEMWTKELIESAKRKRKMNGKIK